MRSSSFVNQEICVAQYNDLSNVRYGIWQVHFNNLLIQCKSQDLHPTAVLSIGCSKWILIKGQYLSWLCTQCRLLSGVFQLILPRSGESHQYLPLYQQLSFPSIIVSIFVNSGVSSTPPYTSVLPVAIVVYESGSAVVSITGRYNPKSL